MGGRLDVLGIVGWMRYSCLQIKDWSAVVLIRKKWRLVEYDSLQVTEPEEFECKVILVLY